MRKLFKERKLFKGGNYMRKYDRLKKYPEKSQPFFFICLVKKIESFF